MKKIEVNKNRMKNDYLYLQKYILKRYYICKKLNWFLLKKREKIYIPKNGTLEEFYNKL